MAISTCTACGEVFKSTGGFDKHRIGTFEPNTRRCMTTDEMIEAGFDIDKSDHWVTGLMSPELARERNERRAQAKMEHEADCPILLAKAVLQEEGDTE